METKKTFLNIGAGPRIKPLEIQKGFQGKYFLVNIDPTYQETFDNLPDIENRHKLFDYYKDTVETEEHFIKATWQEFIPFYRNYFDKVVMYRVLEHVPMTEVLYFIYMVSTILKVHGYVEGIVPNYKTLAEMLLKENIKSKDFEEKNILITTEMLNERMDPHASIWTPDRVKRFFELEGRFNVEDVNPAFEFDGRDIYIKFLAQRIK